MEKVKKKTSAKKSLVQKSPSIIIAFIAIIIVLHYTFSHKSNSSTHISALVAEETGSSYSSYSSSIADSQNTDLLNGYEDNTLTTISPQAKTTFTHDENGLLSAELLNTNTTNRKITKSAFISAYSKEFDSSIEKISTITKSVDGYFSNSYISDYQYDSDRRFAEYTVMVPTEKYDAVIQSFSEACVITEKSETSDDITSTYIDIESRLTSLQAQETRLLELMSSAQNMDEIIAIQTQLTNVQYEIESYLSSKRNYDSMISYSTINLTLTERSNASTTTATYTFWDQAKEAAINAVDSSIIFLQNLAIGFISALPLLALLAIIIFLIYFIKKIVKKKMTKKSQVQDLKNSVIKESITKTTSTEEDQSHNS